MTKRFLLQKIKRSIPISNDVIHPNFNKYYLNRYKNQPIIPITQQYSYAYQRKRKPPIFRNFETRFAEDQIGSIDHESARARTCTHLYSSPLFSFRYRPSCAKFARVSTKIIARPRRTTDSRNESLLRVSVLSNPRVSKFSTIATPFPPPPPVNRIESTIFGSLREASRCIPVFTTRTITRKFCTPRNTRRGRIYTVFGVSHSRQPRARGWMAKSVAEIFAARIGQRLRLNAWVLQDLRILIAGRGGMEGWMEDENEDWKF